MDARPTHTALTAPSSVEQLPHLKHLNVVVTFSDYIEDFSLVC